MKFISELPEIWRDILEWKKWKALFSETKYSFRKDSISTAIAME